MVAMRRAYNVTLWTLATVALCGTTMPCHVRDRRRGLGTVSTAGRSTSQLTSTGPTICSKTQLVAVYSRRMCSIPTHTIHWEQFSRIRIMYGVTEITATVQLPESTRISLPRKPTIITTTASNGAALTTTTFRWSLECIGVNHHPTATAKVRSGTQPLGGHNLAKATA